MSSDTLSQEIQDKIQTLSDQGQGIKAILNTINQDAANSVTSKQIRQALQEQKDKKQEIQNKIEQERKEVKEMLEKERKRLEREKLLKEEQEQRILDEKHERVRGNRNITIDDLNTHETYYQMKKADEERDRAFDLQNSKNGTLAASNNEDHSLIVRIFLYIFGAIYRSLMSMVETPKEKKVI